MKRLSEKRVAEKLKELHGNMAAVARAFGVTRQSVFEYVEARPALLSAKLEAKESILDGVETALHKAALQGEAWAICFLLKTQGKSRGYVERQQLDHHFVDEKKLDQEIEAELAELAGGRTAGPAAAIEGTQGG